MSVPWYLMAKGKGGGGYKTASGPIVSISDAVAAPLRSLLVNIDPVQEGSGDPSPYNVRPISGWSAVNVWRTGKNLLPNLKVTGSGFQVNIGQEATGTNAYGVHLKAGTYSLSATMSKQARAYYRESDGTSNVPIFNLGTDMHGTFTLSKEADVRIWLYNSKGLLPSDVLTFQLELAPTETDYEPYQGNTYTLQLGQTVYGGTLDVTNGVLTVDRAMVDLGTLNYFKTSSTSAIGGSVFSVSVSDVGEGMATRDRYAPNTMISSMFTTAPSSVWWVNDIPDLSMSVNTNALYIADNRYADAATFKAAMSGVQLVYELATPITIHLTPQEISTLKGTNNVWADSGDVTVEYLSAGGANPDLMKLAVAFMGRK